MTTEAEKLKYELNEEQFTEETKAAKRLWYPTPLFCHSIYFAQLMREQKVAHGKFGPLIAEHLPTGRPLMVNDNLEHSYTTGCYDALPDKEYIRWAKHTMQLQLSGLYDRYSPFGQPEPEKVLATPDKPDESEANYSKDESL